MAWSPRRLALRSGASIVGISVGPVAVACGGGSSGAPATRTVIVAVNAPFSRTPSSDT